MQRAPCRILSLGTELPAVKFAGPPAVDGGISHLNVLTAIHFSFFGLGDDACGQGHAQVDAQSNTCGQGGHAREALLQGNVLAHFIVEVEARRGCLDDCRGAELQRLADIIAHLTGR